MRDFVWVLAVAVILVALLLGFMYVDALALTPTPPPATPTTVFCPATITPTSILPTFSLPTADFSTPCPGGCPTGTPGVMTVTPTITPTLTPTTAPAGIIGACYWDPIAIPGTGSCTIAPDGLSAVAVIDSDSSSSGFNVNNLQVFWTSGSYLYGVMDFHGVNSGPSFDHLDFGWVQNGSFIHASGSPNTSAVHWVENRAFIYNDSSPGYIIIAGHSYPYGHVYGTIELSVDGYVPPTATPTASPTPIPCSDGESIETEIISWHPPTTVFGACYTVMPSVLMEVPTLIQEAWDGLIPSEIGVPGVELCLWNWSWDVSFGGLSLMTSIGMIAAMIGASMVVREFRS